mmetsp:Transcript_15251/g.40939  ORF Transcript_15251/g.40939 Transcript_15251/m.40939 type:complete len:219 (+) Transcript_15251:546-1202(+)
MAVFSRRGGRLGKRSRASQRRVRLRRWHAPRPQFARFQGQSLLHQPCLRCGQSQAVKCPQYQHSVYSAYASLDGCFELRPRLNSFETLAPNLRPVPPALVPPELPAPALSCDACLWKSAAKPLLARSEARREARSPFATSGESAVPCASDHERLDDAVVWSRESLAPAPVNCLACCALDVSSSAASVAAAAYPSESCGSVRYSFKRSNATPRRMMYER